MVAMVINTIFDGNTMNDATIIKKLKKLLQYHNEHRYSIAERSIEGLIYDIEQGRRDE